MATATMASAAGAAALIYYTLNKKLQTDPSTRTEDENESHIDNEAPLGIDRVSHRSIQAPATWLETISTLSETLRFTYSETLGKWPIGELAFGINFLLKRQGNLHVASIFGHKDNVQLKGPEIASELKYLLNLLTLCWHFSKKPFPLFLAETGFSQENVLLQEPKAGILKPAFTILIDHKEKQFLLLIRGTHSIKDTLTSVTGAIVPFHHSVVHEGGVSNLVLGYAHCGMVAAARWIAKIATPSLINSLIKYPDYKLKIVGHSLGGGTAALLTYILRERKELSIATCVCFAPAACMTYELAESGNEFITSVINGADLVPTFSVASVDDLRGEVAASAWLNDLRDQIERTRILSTVYRLGSRLPSMASARAKVAGAGAMLRPVSNSTQVVMKRAQSMAQAAWSRPSLQLSSWSCIGPRRRASASASPSQAESSTGKDSPEPLLGVSEAAQTIPTIQNTQDTTEYDTNQDGMTEVELWQQLEQELYDEEEADVVKEMREEEEETVNELQSEGNSVPITKEVHRFYPPGKIMHMVTLLSDETTPESDDDDDDGDSPIEAKVGIFLTPRSLYSKIRLSQTMISDHLMPVYGRQMEKLISEFEMQGTSDSQEADH